MRACISLPRTKASSRSRPAHAAAIRRRRPAAPAQPERSDESPLRVWVSQKSSTLAPAALRKAALSASIRSAARSRSTCLPPENSASERKRDLDRPGAAARQRHGEEIDQGALGLMPHICAGHRPIALQQHYGPSPRSHRVYAASSFPSLSAAEQSQGDEKAQPRDDGPGMKFCPMLGEQMINKKLPAPMSIHSKFFASALRAFAITASLVGAPARADDFPSHPIHLIVPYAAGGSADATARVIARQIGTRRARPSWSKIAAAAPRSSAPRSSTSPIPTATRLLLGQSGPISINPAVYKDLPYDPCKGFCADLAHQHLSLHHGREPLARRQNRAGVRRARQEQARRIELRHDRRRRRQSPADRTVRSQGRHQDDPHSLSRHGACGRRPRRGAGAGGVFRSDLGAATREVG